MRILQVHTRYRQAGGEDAVVATEAALLRSSGHEVVEHHVENPTAPGRAIAALTAAPRNPLAAHRARALAEQVRPDVAHVHNTWFAMSPAVPAALSAAGIPVVVTLHNYRLVCGNAQLFRDGRPCEDCVGSHPWHAVRHGCYRGSPVQSVPAAMTIAANRQTWSRAVELFCALTPFAKERFVAGGLPEDRVVVKPNLVPDPGPREAPPSASREVLAVGRLSPEKGLDTVIKAFGRAQDTRLELVVVGDGPDRARLEAMAGPEVRFLGQCTRIEVQQRLRSARALVFPSLWYETFGLSLVEAMAAGLPCVASRLGGIPHVLGRGGWLAGPGDIEAWSAALRRLTDDAVDTVGKAARREWAERFSPGIVMPTLVEIYERARGRSVGMGLATEGEVE